MPMRSVLLKPEDDLVEDKGASEILGLSNYKTLGNWRSAGKHTDLPYIKIGRSVRYRVGDLIDFRLRHTVGGTQGTKSTIEQVETSASVLVIEPAISQEHPSTSNQRVRPSDLVRLQRANLV